VIAATIQSLTLFRLAQADVFLVAVIEQKEEVKMARGPGVGISVELSGIEFVITLSDLKR